ncbi:hypothetical protein Dsin_032165 [Dipteronia sinensis]|uniref:RNase H type-1 domain-containing protein n=1 Tax=Dipteronia sinensis TaxID=43782 RepID=A0AAE0DT09_9ROSI|nr:hypothetical protein Dsin_032165 [Dipteronia sinensis]
MTFPALKKGGFVPIRDDPIAYQSRLEFCKNALIRRVVLASEYENLPSFCSIYSSISHLPGSCHWNKSKVFAASEGKSSQPMAEVSVEGTSFQLVHPQSSKMVYRPIDKRVQEVPVSNVFAAIYQDLRPIDSVVVHQLASSGPSFIPSSESCLIISFGDPHLGPSSTVVGLIIIPLSGAHYVKHVCSLFPPPHCVLWHSLRDMVGSFSSSWLVVGDFNAVLGAHECLGSRSPIRGSCEDFKSMIDDCSLIGVRSQGRLPGIFGLITGLGCPFWMSLGFLFGMPFSPLFRGVSPLTRGVLFSSRSCLFLSVIILGFYGELVFMRWFGVWYSRNQWIFEGNFVDFRVALSLVWRSVYNANRLGIDCMRNCVDDLLILRPFSLSGRLGRALVIRSVVWSPPASGWIKVNTDGTSLGLPSVGGYRGIFRTCRSFVKACFAVPLGQVSAFEAELLAASLAVNYAWNLGWHRI